MTRAARSFWVLATIAATAIGVLSKALTAPPSPVAGIGVAASATVLVLSLVLAGRILIRLEPTHRTENR